MTDSDDPKLRRIRRPGAEDVTTYHGPVQREIRGEGWPRSTSRRYAPTRSLASDPKIHR
jgi:hypothetical protein